MSAHTKSTAEKYNKLADSEDRFGRTDYLVTRELPRVISKYNVKSSILDFGCGTGLSTRFLKSLNYDCIGVDSNPEMLNLAIQNDPSGIYIKSITDIVLPFENDRFEMVVSTFVLFEIESLNTMISVFKEISRILRHGGTFIAVTGSEELYKRDWLSLDVKNYPENKNPKSGDICRINLKDINLILNDYFWTHDDYVYASKDAGLLLAKSSFPLGCVNDGINWKDEIYYPPYVFYEFIKP